jgi:hypothetical protein
MNTPTSESAADHAVLELLIAWNAGCSRTVDTLVAQAAGNDAERIVRRLCAMAVRVIRIAADARGVQPDDILAMVSRSADLDRSDEAASPTIS